jgi:hypothetical protein
MSKYECWFVSTGKKSSAFFDVDSPKHAAKAFVRRDWYKHIKKLENPWDHIYTIAVRDMAGYIVNLTVSMEPTFYAKNSVKFRTKRGT